MNIEEQLKALILERYKSVRAFAQEIDVPYSTISNIFNRGLGGVSIQVVIKICDALHIDMNYLKEGIYPAGEWSRRHSYEEENTDNSSNKLIPNEAVLVDKYRQLNTDGQARLQEHADLLVQSGMYTTKLPPLPTPEETAAELEELSIQNPLRAMIRDESS